MKKTVFAIVWMAWAASAFACDVCGCSAGGNSIGILPRFSRHFAGIKYNYTSFTSKHLVLFENEEPVYSYEYFTTATLWGRYVPHKRVQVFAFLPYNYFVRKEDGATAVSRGWGDATLMGSYVLFNTTDSAKRKFTHALQAGGGIKLPTGAYTNTHDGSVLNPNMQPGSGSVDFIVNALYTLRYKKAGVNMEAGYTINNPNNRNYWFGNRLTTAVRLFYWKNYRNTSFLPQAGLSYEHRAQDWDGTGEGFLSYTGGNMLAATAAVDVYFNRFALGAGIKQPLSQQMGGGNIFSHPTATASIIYLF